MDLETLEALALSEDRAAALARLVPATVEHDYWMGVHLQHAGRLDEVDALLARWDDRHPHDRAPRERLARRQLLLRAGVDLRAVAERLALETNADLSQQPLVESESIRYPHRLDPATYDRDALVDGALARQRRDLSLFNPAAADALLTRWRALDPAQRSALLEMLGPTSDPALVELLAAVLSEREHEAFASLSVTRHLTLAQLEALAARVPALRESGAWVDAVLRRLEPGPLEDHAELSVLDLWIERALSFLRKLGPSFNRLRARALAARLEVDRRRGRYDRARILEFLALPRAAPWAAEQHASVPHEHIVSARSRGERARLPDAPEDEALARDAVARLLEREDGEALAPWLSRRWLDELRARVRLTAGDVSSTQEQQRWTSVLGPEAVAALRDEVRLELTPDNPARIAADARVQLSVELKNVPELIIKVFAIDVVAYFAARQASVDAAIDLDGMVAAHERTLSFDTNPMRVQRVQIEVPECDGPGTYVVELIGNGRSSRALVRKGWLRVVTQDNAAGTAVYVFDERGAPQRDATLWLGSRLWGEGASRRADGGVQLPFSAQGSAAALVVAAGRAQVERLALASERYSLSLHARVEREALVAQRRARLVCAPTLEGSMGALPASLLESATLELRATRADGVSSTRVDAVSVADHEELVVELPIAEDITALELRLRGSVRVVSTGALEALEASTSVELNGVHQSEACASLDLVRTSEGASLELHGRSGEPRADRVVHVQLWSRALREPIEVFLQTDERGRAHLGALDDIVAVSASIGDGASGRWSLDEALPAPTVVHLARGERLSLPVDRYGARASLASMRGGAPCDDRSELLSIEGRALRIEGLEPGEYTLYGSRGARTTIRVAPSVGDRAWLAADAAMLQRGGAAPFIRAASTDDEGVELTIEGATRSTRVHLIATSYAPQDAASFDDRLVDARSARLIRTSAAESEYLSNRDLGDEYRYVIERRRARRRAGVMLEKPSLLSNPWARRSTSTGRESLSTGEGYTSSSAYAAAPAPEPRARGESFARESWSPSRSYDFLSTPAIVLANLRPDERGALRVPRDALGDKRCLTALVVDARAGDRWTIALEDRPSARRDLRLRHALDPSAHFAEERSIRGARAHEEIVIDDVRSARVELIDTVASAWRALSSIEPDCAPNALAFVSQWASLSEQDKRARYSEHACHELHLFLARKDPTFFERFVRPHLSFKRHKTFVDRALLGEDLSSWLDPWRFSRLNAVEKLLLARAIPSARAAIARLMGDQVETTPPDPERERRTLDAMLGASSLDERAMDETAREVAAEERNERPKRGMRKAQVDDEASDSFAAIDEEERDDEAPTVRRSFGGGGEGDASAQDKKMRGGVPSFFRGVDETQEWAESNWYRLDSRQATADRAKENRFWLDLIRHDQGPFLSPHLADCATNVTEALAALAWIDLPFVAGAHETRIDGDDGLRAVIRLASDALVVTARVVAASPSNELGAILVGQSYLRNDDRFEWDGGVQREKHATSAMLVAIAYTTRVVVSNPTSVEQNLSVLLQVPRGSMPVAGGFFTRTISLRLEPYATQSIEYSFYFPEEGEFSHFGAHVTREGALVAFAPSTTLRVRRTLDDVDLTSWPHLSQHGTIEQIVERLAQDNLARIDLGLIAWRLRERAAFDAVLSTLESRMHFDERLWAYALLHGDVERTRRWLRFREDYLRECGPALEGAIVELDALERGEYEHLEFAPLVNARTHSAGARRVVLNEGLSSQWRALLELVAHRAAPTHDDLLSAAHYLFAQDRFEEGVKALARVDPSRVSAKPALEYLRAYASLCAGDVAQARSVAAPWSDYVEDRWRRRFVALLSTLDEVERGASSPARAASDATREETLDALASREAQLELVLEEGRPSLRHRGVRRCEVRAYRMDLELLFSRQPFVQGDVSRFSWIAPGYAAELALERDGQTTIALPPSLALENLVIEARAAGLRRSVARYSNDLRVELSEQTGQLRALRASSDRPIPATYVKVFARHRDGCVRFFKDGYTDVRGRFDYASLSTNDLDTVERFAMLVASDEGAGSTVLEAAPPQR